jgi:hypothetical protein
MMRTINFATDEEKKMLFGPFLIPNKLIYRKDETNGEYYVRFSSGEIKKIAEKFNEQLKNKEINLMHTDESVNAFVFENWVIEGSDDKSKKFGFDLPEGTWFGGVKIKDDKFWNDEVKSEKVKGFSVEILANLELKMIKKIKKQSMKKEVNLDLGSSMLGDGTTPIFYDGDMIEVGTAIFTDEAMTVPADDDRWVLEDGRTIVVIDGAVESIEDGMSLAADGPCYEGYEMVGTKIDENGKEVPNCVPVKDGKPEPMEAAADPMAPMETPGAPALTSEEVTLMIDSRYQELMDEITNLKNMMGDKEKEYQEYKKQITEKFKMTPSETSIKKDVAKTRFNDKFSEMEAKVKAFAKVK